MSNYINRKRNRRRYKTRYKYNGVYNNRRSRSASNKKAAVIVSVAVFFLVAVLAVTFAFGDSIYKWFGSLNLHLTPDEKSIVETSAPTEPQDEQKNKPTEGKKPEPTQKPTEKDIQDSEFTSLLSQSGYTVDSIKSDQLILVQSSGTSANILCYEKNSNGKWEKALNEFYGYVGANGVSLNISDGDGCTPAGLFNIEYAFGTSQNPGTEFEYKPITYMSHWVLDPNSQYYNQWVEYSDYSYDGIVKDWESSEWLWEYSVSYSYGINFGYNQNPATPGNGSGIFIQCASSPTYGGVGMNASDLASVICWLKPGKSPAVLIF